MKVFTEEQMIEAIELAREKYPPDFVLTTKGIMHQFTPTELPSDEDIYKASFFKDGSDYSLGEHSGFIEGAKWMKEQIAIK